ncbi:MAG TPA: hypothetical protein VFS43_23915 [Polyangiaceae bacterium]|nr:hypothetical protein [Polyangiaceae bacterium]
MKAPDAPYHPPALRAYARARHDASAGLRAARVLAACATLALAIAMAIVRSSDGSAAYLEGVVTRGLSLHLLLVALPFGYALAGRRVGDRDASFTLAALHGVDRRAFDATMALQALRAAGLRGAAGAGLLAAEMVVLSLPEASLASKRAALALAFAATGAALGAALALLGLAAARAAGRFGRLAFIGAWALPSLLAGLVPGYPAWGTLLGAYRTWLGVLL